MPTRGFKSLIRRHPGVYLKYVIPATLAVLGVAIVQHVVVLDIPLREIRPPMLVLPGLVGGLFGFLLATIRALALDQRRHLERIEAQKRSLREEITQRIRTQKQQQRLAFALEAANDGLWDWDIRSGDVYYSPRWIDMLGYRPEDVAPRYEFWSERLHPEDAPRVLANLTAHLKGEAEQFRQEFRTRGADGQWVWVLGRGKVMERDVQGNPLRAVGTQTDISERRRAQEELLTEKERAQVTLASIGEGVITTDAQGIIDFINPVACELTGWPAPEALGQSFTRVCPLHDEVTQQPLENAIARCMRERITFSPVEPLMLLSRSAAQLTVELSVAPIRTRDGNVQGAVAVLRDISATHAMARQISWQATHDALTGLVNRKEFEERLQESIAQNKTQPHALLYMDLDQFKVVNDTCGHSAGDELLRSLAANLHQQVRHSDVLARLGGDEFGVILLGCDAVQAQEIADKLTQSIREFRFAWQGKFFDIGVSIGIVMIEGEGMSVASAMSAADIACYAAKDLGRNRAHMYQPDDAELARRHGEMHWVSRIRHALEENRFVLCAQRISGVRDGAADMHEILVRMIDEAGGWVAPGSFIPAAERYGLMVQIDRWVIEHAFAALVQAQDGIRQITINLSALSLTDPGMRDFICECQQRHGVDADAVCFEVTETAAIANLSHAIAFLAELRASGFHFALDDFGSGLSSFGYLKSLPVDFLKIDGSFVRDMCNDAIDRAMVHAINEIGHTMGIRTIAEYVEDAAILDALRSIGVDFAQGYFIDKPSPLGRPAPVNARG